MKYIDSLDEIIGIFSFVFYKRDIHLYCYHVFKKTNENIVLINFIKKRHH